MRHQANFICARRKALNAKTTSRPAAKTASVAMVAPTCWYFRSHHPPITQARMRTASHPSSTKRPNSSPEIVSTVPAGATAFDLSAGGAVDLDATWRQRLQAATNHAHSQHDGERFDKFHHGRHEGGQDGEPTVVQSIIGMLRVIRGCIRFFECVWRLWRQVV